MARPRKHNPAPRTPSSATSGCRREQADSGLGLAAPASRHRGRMPPARLDLVAIDADEGKSGKSMKNRPAGRRRWPHRERGRRHAGRRQARPAEPQRARLRRPHRTGQAAWRVPAGPRCRCRHVHTQRPTRRHRARRRRPMGAAAHRCSDLRRPRRSSGPRAENRPALPGDARRRRPRRRAPGKGRSWAASPAP